MPHRNEFVKLSAALTSAQHALNQLLVNRSEETTDELESKIAALLAEICNLHAKRYVHLETINQKCNSIITHLLVPQSEIPQRPEERRKLFKLVQPC